MSPKHSISIFSSLLALAVAGACTALADTPNIVPLITNLAPNTANQQIQFLITGTDNIAGEDLNFEINSGTTGPLLSSVDILTNTIFAGNNTGQNNFSFPNGVVNSGTLAGRLGIVSTTTNAATVTDNGLLVTLLVSTVGLDSTNTPSFAINLYGTANGDSNLVLPDASTIAPSYPHALFSIGNAQRAWSFNGGGTWNLDSNWSPFAPYLAGDPANFLSAITTSSTVTLDGNRTAGSLLFNNTAASYNLSQGTGGTLFLNNGTASPFITDSGGNHTINVPLSLAGTTIVTVTRAADTLTISGALNAPSTNLTLNGSGTLLLGGISPAVGQITGTGNLAVNAGTSLTSNGIQINSLQLNGNLTIRANTGATSSQFTAGVSVLNSLTLAGTGPSGWTGKLDLMNNALIINTTGATGNKASVLSTLLTQVSEAQNGTNNTWTGTGGITSSTVAVNPTVFGLAVADNSASGGLGLTNYRGQSVGANAIIVVAAHIGDVTLDGVIDIQDLNKVTANWQKTGALWSDGDTTGPNGFSDGKVDIQDLNAVTAIWQATGLAPLAPGGSPSLGGGAVPEPASLALLALAIPVLMYRRNSIRIS